MPQPKVLKQARAALITVGHLYTAIDEPRRSRLIAHLRNALASMSMFYGNFDEVTPKFLDTISGDLSVVIRDQYQIIDARRWNG